MIVLLTRRSLRWSLEGPTASDILLHSDVFLSVTPVTPSDILLHSDVFLSVTLLTGKRLKRNVWADASGL
jgi:hypothetical protein